MVRLWHPCPAGGMTSCSRTDAEPAGQALLAAPMGVVRLTDMIGDPRPALRNEALLLLVGLSRSSPDIQRLAAFEGAFDRLLVIVRSGITMILHASRS